MKNEQLTPIFPPHVKPVHAGVYLADTSSDEEGVTEYAYWNGYRWYIQAKTPEDAEEFFRLKQDSMFQDRYWRGLANEPQPKP